MTGSLRTRPELFPAVYPELRPALLAAAVLIAGIVAAPASAQTVLDRTTNLAAGWTAYPGAMYANLPFRFTTPAGGPRNIAAFPTFELSMGIPWNVLAGARFAPQSPTVAGHLNEWEFFLRSAPLSENRGDAFELGTTLGFNTAAGSLDSEVSVARWFGPMRLIGAARGMTDGYGEDGARFGVAGGGVLHPLPGRAPIALTGDVGTLTDRGAGERIAWSVGVALGISFTPHTLALFATNTATSTLQGRARGGDRVRYGFEFTVPIPAGRFLGWYVPREAAAQAVRPEPAQPARVVRAEATRYLFLPLQIVVPAGTTIEWTNRDAVLHTVAADDGSWNSGAIHPGERWSATFTEPGRYPFHCGPHPFMQGVVLVH
jgi:plastocyanin